MRTPPPAVAMRLAQEHRHDLLKAAEKQPAGSRTPGLSPVWGFRALSAGLAKFAHRRDARPVKSSVAATAPELG